MELHFGSMVPCGCLQGCNTRASLIETYPSATKHHFLPCSDNLIASISFATTREQFRGDTLGGEMAFTRSCTLRAIKGNPVLESLETKLASSRLDTKYRVYYNVCLILWLSRCLLSLYIVIYLNPII